MPSRLKTKHEPDRTLWYANKTKRKHQKTLITEYFSKPSLNISEPYPFKTEPYPDRTTRSPDSTAHEHQKTLIARHISKPSPTMTVQDRHRNENYQDSSLLYNASNLLTISEIAFPSAFPASSLVATPITLPISDGAFAPSFSITAFTLASTSAGDN
jgi:hypothetical protein